MTDEKPPAGPVLAAHRFDEQRLADFLRQRDLLAGTLTVMQFQGGQSNPTFYLESGSRRYVLRKKPPGKVLPSAHQVDREYRVMKALGDSIVPVPVMRALCEDDSVIGTTFYVMDFLPGRVYSDPRLPKLPKEERTTTYFAMIDVLAALHSVDYRAVGLEGFGRPEGYVARQVKRWRSQYEASQTEELPAMDQLTAWLEKNIPADDDATIAHGDFRLGNLMLALDEPKVIAVLDWELATIGHPLADLAYCCMPYHLNPGPQGVGALVGTDLALENLPEERQLLDRYAEVSGRGNLDDYPFFLAFAMFRYAAILQGIYSRALQGNASNARALEVGKCAGYLAGKGWQVAQSAG